MKLSFRPARLAAPAIAAALFCLPFINGCTEVDDTLGLGLVPEDQKMKVGMATLTTGIESYVVLSDSLPTSNSLSVTYPNQYFFLGKLQDPEMGDMDAGVMMQMVPYLRTPRDSEKDKQGYIKKYNESFMGYKPIWDSVKIYLYIENVYGTNKGVEQSFSIYALEDSLKKANGKHYYIKDDMSSFVNRDKPLFRFKLSDEHTTSGEYKLEVVEPYGKEWLDKLVGLDSATYAKYDTEFGKHFYGLSILPDEDSEQNASLYSLKTEATPSDADYIYSIYGYYPNSTASTTLSVYGRTHKWSDPTAVRDTIEAVFAFNGNAYKNRKVNVIERNYPAALAAMINDTIPGATMPDKTYVEGLWGLNTYLRFTDKLVENLEALKVKDGIQYSSILINSARLYVKLADDEPEVMDLAPLRLGMYTNMKSYSPGQMVDYMYAVYYESQNSSTNYDGYIKRGKGHYVMDITAYVTRLINGTEKNPRGIWVGDPYQNFFSAYSKVALKGVNDPDDPGIWLDLTYTLVK